MRKTSVYLTEAESRRLAELARIEGCSRAHVLREAIASYQPKGAPDRDFELTRCGSGPGGSIADVPTEDLLQGFGE